MHADCTGVIDANPIFAMAEAVGAESGGDNDDQEELDDMVFHLLHYTALTALSLACFTLSQIQKCRTFFTFHNFHVCFEQRHESSMFLRFCIELRSRARIYYAFTIDSNCFVVSFALRGGKTSSSTFVVTPRSISAVCKMGKVVIECSPSFSVFR